MQVIFDCSNTITDSIYLIKPLQQNLEQFPGQCVALIVLDELGGHLIAEHFREMLPVFFSLEQAKNNFPDIQVLPLSAERAAKVFIEIESKNKKKIHISQAFGLMLGVDVFDITPPLHNIVKKGDDKNIALIAPFSQLCGKHFGRDEDKTLKDWKWEHIIRYLRRHNFEVLCFGVSSDLLSNVSLPISSYRSVTSLKELEELFQSLSLVITVENDLAHLSCLYNIPTVLLWPEVVHKEYLAPVWAPRTSYLFVGNPRTAEPASILFGLKRFLPKLLGS